MVEGKGVKPLPVVNEATMLTLHYPSKIIKVLKQLSFKFFSWLLLFIKVYIMYNSLKGIYKK